MAAVAAVPADAIAVTKLTEATETTEATKCKPLDLAPWRQQIANRQLSFVAIDLRRRACFETNRADADRRHAPWSTFKIPHLLIALETQAVTSPEAVVPWDAARRPAAEHWPQGWRQGQSLSSAFERSAAWYFQDLVALIGRPNYAHWLRRFSYGNLAIPIDRDDFWLGGPLMISAREQAAFLACVATSGCGAAPTSVRVLEAVALSEVPSRARLFGKTGSGPVVPGQFEGAFEGWYVGYVKTHDSKPIAAFALHVRGDNFAAIGSFRQAMAVTLLRHLRFLPK